MPKRDPGAFRGTSEEPLRCLRGEAPLKAPGIAAVLMCQHFLGSLFVWSRGSKGLEVP